MTNNQEKAALMALRSRKKVLESLNIETLHENMIKLIKDYHSLLQFEPAINDKMMEWVTYKKCMDLCTYFMHPLKNRK